MRRSKDFLSHCFITAPFSFLGCACVGFGGPYSLSSDRSAHPVEEMSVMHQLKMLT